jgi:type IV pilus assembly protein PilN
MVSINLLPYRQVQRQQAQRLFYWHVLSILLVSIVAATLVDHLIERLIHQEATIHQLLTTEIQQLNTEEQAIHQIKQSIQHLQNLHVARQHLHNAQRQAALVLPALAQHIPAGLYLKRLTQQHHVITLHGVARNHDAVATFMQHLNASPFFTAVTLHQIQANTATSTAAPAPSAIQPLFSFSLSFSLAGDNSALHDIEMAVEDEGDADGEADIQDFEDEDVDAAHSETSTDITIEAAPTTPETAPVQAPSKSSSLAHEEEL